MTGTPNLHQARRYIRRIKQELGPTSPRYRAFLNVLRRYGSSPSTESPRDLIDRVRDLLAGHEGLLHGLKVYLPERYDASDDNDDDEEIPITISAKYEASVILAWIEGEKDVNLDDISERVHVQCTKCRFCNGKRNAVAIRENEPILLCELKGCNREYHLDCLPEGLVRKEDGPDAAVADGSCEHIIYIDTELDREHEEDWDDSIPPGEIYCKECVAEGSTAVLRQYFTRCEAIRSHYSCSRDYVLSLLERHMLDNLNGNLVDAHGMPVFADDENEEVHLKPPPRSELWYVDEMNQMARADPFEKDGGTSGIVAEGTGEEKDEWSAADFLIGKPVRLYCNLDNEYHNGRIIDWRTCLVYPNSDMHRLYKSSKKTVHINRCNFYGVGPISSCEFLVHFPAGEGRRKKDLSQWMILEEHSLAVGITLVRGQYDAKSTSPEKWRPAMVLARSALELVPVREFLQEGSNGELFGQKKLEEAESGVSSTDDLLALTSFFGGKGKDHEVLNLRNEVTGLITWDLLEKYHVNEDVDEKAEVDSTDEQNDGTTSSKRHLSITVPPKMALALAEYKKQQQCNEKYKTLIENLFETRADNLSAYTNDDAEVDQTRTGKESSSTKLEHSSSLNLLNVDDNDVTDAVMKEESNEESENDTFDKSASNTKSNARLTDEGSINTSETGNKIKYGSNIEISNEAGDRPSVEPAAEYRNIGIEQTVTVIEKAAVHDNVSSKDVKSVLVEINKSEDESSLGLDVEEECDEGIYADYDVIEIYEEEDDDDSSSMSVISEVEPLERFGHRSSYSQRKGIKGTQTGKLSRNRNVLTPDYTEKSILEKNNGIQKGQTVIGGKRVSVDVFRTGHRGRPRHANASPESNKALAIERAPSRKRVVSHTRPQREPKKPRIEAKKTRHKPKQKPSTSKPKPSRGVVDESESSDDEVPNHLPSELPRGITQRPSGKWQAQLYYAGKSRYLGVFKNKKNAFKAYEVARNYLLEDSAAQNATASADVNLHISRARKAAHDSLKK